MARWRITSLGPPRLGAAAIPVPSPFAMGYQSRGPISGNPGVSAIPAPRPPAVPQDWSNRLHNSAQAPPWWLPAVYFLRGQQEHASVSVASDNQMPVPAIPYAGIPAERMVRPTFLGQTQVANPKRVVSYRNFTGRPG